VGKASFPGSSDCTYSRFLTAADQPVPQYPHRTWQELPGCRLGSTMPARTIVPLLRRGGSAYGAGHGAGKDPSRLVGSFCFHAICDTWTGEGHFVVLTKEPTLGSHHLPTTIVESQKHDWPSGNGN